MKKINSARMFVFFKNVRILSEKKANVEVLKGADITRSLLKIIRQRKIKLCPPKRWCTEIH